MQSITGPINYSQTNCQVTEPAYRPRLRVEIVKSRRGYHCQIAAGTSYGLAEYKRLPRIMAGPMKVLVTGAAGFIGSATAKRLLDRKNEVVGLDNLNDYYDVSLKQARLAGLQSEPRFRFARLDLANREAIASLFAQEKFERVVHLGAQAGVRYSLKDPDSYIQSNIVGTMNILEGCRRHAVEHLVYASSSS